MVTSASSLSPTTLTVMSSVRIRISSLRSACVVDGACQSGGTSLAQAVSSTPGQGVPLAAGPVVGRPERVPVAVRGPCGTVAVVAVVRHGVAAARAAAQQAGQQRGAAGGRPGGGGGLLVGGHPCEV